jgi:enoyl-[acyl-carrier protein] reductase II
VLHVVSSSVFARKAEDASCDAVVAEGFEAGGHNGREETTTMVLSGGGRCGENTYWQQVV